MVDAARHPKIDVRTYTNVERVEGYVGNFKVQLREKARYVRADRCNGCGECSKACPIEVPNYFEMNLAPRKAAYVPMSQSVPLLYTIDEEACIHCYKCVDACGPLEAIDFSQEDKIVWEDIGSIIVATGFNHFDPSVIPEYGYGRFPNVITAMEMERLNNSAGPTTGNLIRPSDQQNPQRLAIINCVGSRDKRFNPWCSNFCCMYAIKNAVLLKQMNPELDISVYYMDIRTPSKGYEEFYDRARSMGIRFIQGRPSLITEDLQTHNLFVHSEDVSLGKVVEHEYDMVMLNQAAVPQPDVDSVSSVLNITQSPGGWFMEYHPKLRPVDSPTDGIFLAGACQGLKDIPSSVSSGLATASRASRILHSDEWEIEPIIAQVWEDRCVMADGKMCGVCAKACPYGAIVIEEGKAASVVVAKCHGCGGCVAECPHNAITQMHFTDAQVLAQMRALLAEKPEEKIFAFRCHWCSYGGADLAGTSHFDYSANERGIRVMCSARMDNDFIYEAFRLGAGAVLYSGCHPQDCHYITGQQVGATRANRLQKLFEKLEMTPGRFRVEWISAAEGDKYARIINEMQQVIDSMPPEKLHEEIERIKPEMEKRSRRMYETPEIDKAVTYSDQMVKAITAKGVESGN
ncbi:MAG TPA: methyl-viologen-reducing hydrogenase subunit delta [Anaerolineaceae bacterium]|nr:methyl-viologen-reducing hydrogenase subunit delta [Anaerolineaceae bacterium]